MFVDDRQDFAFCGAQGRRGRFDVSQRRRRPRRRRSLRLRQRIPLRFRRHLTLARHALQDLGRESPSVALGGLGRLPAPAPQWRGVPVPPAPRSRRGGARRPRAGRARGPRAQRPRRRAPAGRRARAPPYVGEPAPPASRRRPRPSRASRAAAARPWRCRWPARRALDTRGRSCAPRHSRRTATADSMQISQTVPSPGWPVGHSVCPAASCGGGAESAAASRGDGAGSGAAAASVAARSGRDDAGEGVTGRLTGPAAAAPRLRRRSASAASSLRRGPMGRPRARMSSASSESRQASSIISRWNSSRYRVRPRPARRASSSWVAIVARSQATFAAQRRAVRVNFAVKALRCQN